MKRKTIAFVSLFLFPFSALAASFTLDLSRTFNQSSIVFFDSSLRLTAEAEGEIGAKHGVAISLPEFLHVLWQDPQTLMLSGSAVEAGRVEATLEPTFSVDFKTLYFPVLADFSSGEQVVIEGLKMRTYKKSILGYGGTLALDLTGDGQPEQTLFSAFKVKDESYSDHVAPYPPTELKAELDFEKGQVHLSWVKPVDYDYMSFTVHKVPAKDAALEAWPIISSGSSVSQFIDEGLKEGEEFMYRVHAYDQSNQSVAAEITVDFTPEPEQTPEEETAEEETLVEEETEEEAVEEEAVEEEVTEEEAVEEETEEEPTAVELSTNFTDVSASDWFFEAVVYGEKEAGFFDPADTFDPTAESNRAQYAKLLALFIESEVGYNLPSLSAFDDVPLSHWAALPVYSLVEQGVLTGYKYDNGTLTGQFGLADVITREQAFAALVRALGLPVDLNASSPFSDVTPDDWSYALIVSAHQNGLTQGQSPTFFNKNAPLNRAELAQMFYNAAQWMEGQ